MKKFLFAALMILTVIFVVSCSGDEDTASNEAGTSCSTDGMEACSQDYSQILICQDSEWKATKTCNLNFGQYCRQTANGSFSCTDSGNTNDSTETEPETNDNEPTEPETNDNEPTEPETNDTEPTEPETNDNEPTEPETNDNEPTEPETNDNEPDDSEPTDDSDTTPESGSGLKITGTVTLFHPSALPSSTYTSFGGVQDGSSYFPPCETSVTLGENSVYGSLTVNLNTPHIATVEEMAVVEETGLSGTENFLQVSHSVSGEMGSSAYPKYSTGITMSYYQDLTNSETGEITSVLFIDDMDLINGNISSDYAIRIICPKDKLTSGLKKIGPYEGDDCEFYILNFATQSNPNACYHALGVSDPSLVDTGLTFTIQ